MREAEGHQTGVNINTNTASQNDWLPLRTCCEKSILLHLYPLPTCWPTAYMHISLGCSGYTIIKILPGLGYNFCAGRSTCPSSCCWFSTQALMRLCLNGSKISLMELKLIFWFTGEQNKHHNIIYVKHTITGPSYAALWIFFQPLVKSWSSALKCSGLSALTRCLCCCKIQVESHSQ